MFETSQERWREAIHEIDCLVNEEPSNPPPGVKPTLYRTHSLEGVTFYSYAHILPATYFINKLK